MAWNKHRLRLVVNWSDRITEPERLGDVFLGVVWCSYLDRSSSVESRVTRDRLCLRNMLWCWSTLWHFYTGRDMLWCANMYRGKLWSTYVSRGMLRSSHMTRHLLGN